VTALLFALSTSVMFVFTRLLPADPNMVAMGIAVAYPLASYLLNLLWVFKLH